MVKISYMVGSLLVDQSDGPKMHAAATSYGEFQVDEDPEPYSYSTMILVVSNL